MRTHLWNFLLGLLLFQFQFIYSQTSSQTDNILSIPNTDCAAGSVASVAIQLTNISEIVAVQFDMQLPVNAKLRLSNTSDIKLSERKKGHVVSVKSNGNSSYTLVITSGQNAVVRGNKGDFILIPLKIEKDATIDARYDIKLSKIVLSDKQGNNIASSVENTGQIHIVSGERPDITVRNISATPTELKPEGMVTVSWQVANIGELPTKDKFKEQIYLVNPVTGDELYLGELVYSENIGNGSSVTRSADFPLAKQIGIDGAVVPKVKLSPYPNLGELPGDAENNIVTGTSSINIAKELSLEMTNVLDESNTTQHRCYLYRSGSQKNAETFNLANTNSARLNVPVSVTIPSNESGVLFYIKTVNDNIVNADSTAVVTISGNGYSEIKQTVWIADDEVPELTATVNPATITEGESAKLTINRHANLTKNSLTVKLSCDHSNRFNYDKEVVIPAGKASAEVTLSSIDDDQPNITEEVVFTLSAPGYTGTNAFLTLKDNDVPNIELSIEPTILSESSGPQAAIATLKRTRVTDNKITIKLTDTAEGSLYYPQSTITLEKGVTEYQFAIGVKDDSKKQGDRKVKFTAAVYVASCSCSTAGTSAGTVEKELTILDDDSEALKLTTSQITLLEGKENATVLTVTRNTSTEQPLTVKLACDKQEDLVFASSVTIPAGKESVGIPVSVKKNETTEGNRTVTFTVSADGFSSGVCWVMVTDQTLPDATVSITSTIRELQTKGEITIDVVVSNKGAANLPSQTQVQVYLSDRSQLGSASYKQLLGTLYTQTSLVPNSQETIHKTLALPDKTGSYYLIASVNPVQSVKELTYVNNDSEGYSILLDALYKIQVSTNKTTYKPGENIIITGQASGGAVAGVSVDLYVICEGNRQVINVTTDSKGIFQKTFTPESWQIGHISIGACYPDEGLKDEMVGVDVYGLRLASASNLIKIKATENVPFKASLDVENPGDKPLTNIKVEIVSKPENCTVAIDPVSTIDAKGKAKINYTVTGLVSSTGADWENIKIRLNSTEGASLDLNMYYYCYASEPQLEASVTNLNTTMTIGEIREYPITITNMGKGETGDIYVSLPKADWLSLASPEKMSSLSFGQSATVLLRMSPGENLPANIVRTGQFVINCSKGDGVSIAYKITPVSEKTGTLKVNLTDEYSYDVNPPKTSLLTGAKIRLTQYGTDNVVASGITDMNGVFLQENIPSGYYILDVTADKHDSYRSTVMIDPGKENVENAFLSFKAITYSLDVVETTVEDIYEIKTTATFETQIPAPVVLISLPSDLTLQNQVFPITIGNLGLIKALDVTLDIPEVDGVQLDVLSDAVIPELLPNQTIQLYVKMTLNWPMSLRSGIETKVSERPMPCIVVGAKALYHYLCGGYDKFREEMARKSWGDCMAGGIGLSGGGGSGSGSGSGIGKPGVPMKENEMTIDDEGVIHRTIITNCDECLNKLGNKIRDCAIGFIPWVGCGWGVYQCWQSSSDGDFTGYDIAGCLFTLGGCATSTLAYPIGAAINVAACLTSFGEPCLKYGPETKAGTSTGYPSYVIDFQNKIASVKIALEAYHGIYTEFLGEGNWSNCTNDELQAIFSYLSGIEKGKLLNKKDQMLQKCRPESITQVDFDLFIDRVNNTVEKENGNTVSSNNYIDLSKIADYKAEISKEEEAAKNQGYKNLNDLWEKEYKKISDKLNNSSSSVCATIGLQFSQTMTMTRQAFKGTLTVFNGHESVAMKNVKLNLEVKDEDGKVATSHEIQITPKELKTFTGDLEGEWELAAQQTGSAVIEFIPTKYAAPTEPKKYSFGGTLSYLDPFTNLVVTRDLYPVTMTVNPSPNLKMTYFMQRDLLGDDPLTKDVVEPTEPAEFSLLIHNIGAGEGANIRMNTKQPEIEDNEKGLAIDFKMIGSTLNGDEKSLPLNSDGSTSTNFGNIPAGGTAYAQWWFTSSLLGHFTKYDVKATHVTSYGNPNLSLLDTVTIHELIRSVKYAEDDKLLAGFLVNDIKDSEDQSLPDAIYLSDGSIEDVAVTTNAICSGNNTRYTLTVNPKSAGWNYGNINDPTGGHQKLVSVTRKSDGVSIDLRNIWLTDRTLRNGKDPLYENRLHFVDKYTSTQPVEYTLTFEPRPAVYLKVESIEGAPKDVVNEAVTELTVRFNKPIDVSTFTAEDITLNCQGTNIDLSGLKITPIGTDNQTFKLDITALTKDKDGYFVLTVQTADIKDTENFNGESGTSTSWNQFIGGKVTLTFLVNPEKAGKITPESGSFDYNSQVALTATPEYGYRFRNWTINGESYSTDATYKHLAIASKTIIANFDPVNYTITMKCDPLEGMLVNVGTGSYPYSDTVILEAAPTSGYQFAGWAIGDKVISTDNPLAYTVKGNETIEAKFTPVDLDVTMPLSAGWNWVSVNTADTKEPKEFLSKVLDKVERFQSQSQELTNDPALGLTGNLKELDPKISYKLKLSQAGEIQQKGAAIVPDKITIPLQKGWNWLGYIPGQASTPNTVFANLKASLNDEVKGQNGFAQFNGSGWIGTLQVMEPGEGYMYHANQKTEFQYARVYATTQSANLRSGQLMPWSYDSHKYPNNMSIVANVYNNTMTQEPGVFTVGAFVGKECRGIGQYIEGLLFMTVYGGVNNEKVSFKAYENATGQVFDLNEIVSFSESSVGNVSLPYSLHLNNYATGTERIDFDIYTYPNPVKNYLYIGGDFSRIKQVMIIGLNGVILLKQKMGGTNAVDFSSFADGFYLIALETQEGYIYKKVLKSANGLY